MHMKNKENPKLALSKTEKVFQLIHTKIRINLNYLMKIR